MTAIESAFPRELEIAGRLARQAGELAVSLRDGDLEIELKPGDEPVTIADKRASDLVVEGLHAAFPDDVIISEENADDLRRLEASRVWYVDPIDGTKDFIRGDVGFCVMIGLTLEARPAVGVVYHPPSKRLFCAAPDSGAWVLPSDGEPQQLAVSDVSELTGVRLVASKSHRSPVLDQVKGVIGIASELNIGSVGLKLAIIAAGERDLYVNPSSRSSVWDTCAPEAILAEAGGRLTDGRGRPLRYDTTEVGHLHGLVASNGHLHDAAIARLAPLFPET